MASVDDVAAHLLSRLGPMPSATLHKLLYFAQAWCLAWSDAPLFDGRIEAWPIGPVVRPLYNNHRGTFTLERWGRGNPDRLTDSERGVVDVVIDVYGPLDGRRLGFLARSEGPWHHARSGLSPTEPGESEITVAAIRAYYRHLDADPTATPVEEIDWDTVRFPPWYPPPQVQEETVAEVVKPQVKVIAYTHFDAPDDVDWSTDADGGQALAEFAGRACYQSWNKPNPATATNAGYLRHILEVGHLSVLEHGSVTFYLTGVSRSFTHELIRHRHFSYSQLSQRYVPGGLDMVVPDAIAADPAALDIFTAVTDTTLQAYRSLVVLLEDRIRRGGGVDHHQPCGTTIVWDNQIGAGGFWCPACARPVGSDERALGKLTTAQRKQARQAARAVLPNATETRIVVTGNYRAWRHFVAMRATEHADVEIREVAVACLRELQRVAPNVFADFTITTLADGSEVASTNYRES